MVDASIILADAPAALVELCGISILERLLRTLQRCGVKRAIVLSATPKLIAEHLAQPSWARAQIEVTIRNRESRVATVDRIVDVWPKPAQLLLLVGGDTVFDIRLLRLLSTQSSTTALVDSAVPPELQSLVASAPNAIRGKFCSAALFRYEWAVAQSGSFDEVVANGLAQGTVAALDVAEQPLYYLTMRREIRPFWFHTPPPAYKKTAERVLLDSIQKGTQDIPALVHAPIENFLISHLCKTSITPNQLTILCSIVGWITTILFATGQLFWGIALALVVGVLDGLDGKQARIKVETSKGGKLEHWFDAFFEISWWTALAYYFRSSGQLPNAFYYLALLLVAEATDLIAKGSVYFICGKVIDELGAFERMVRLVGGRRNVYVWILTAGLFLGAPGKAFIVMAWLEAATAVVHLPRAAWAVWVRRRNARSKPSLA
jgi:phosphatidylglycerophosphate synthase